MAMSIEKAKADYKATIAALNPSFEDLLAAQKFSEKVQIMRKRIGLEPFNSEQLQLTQMKFLEVKLQKR